MARYVARPVLADAWQIVEVQQGSMLDRCDLSYSIRLEGSSDFILLTHAQVARHRPVKGDYFVRQQDGYEYVAPKAVHERKYRCIEREGFDDDAPAAVGDFLEDLAQQVRAGELEVEPDEAVVVFNELDRGYLVTRQNSLSVTDVVTALAAGQHIMLNTLMPFGNETHPTADPSEAG